jgi:hypothetical protein
MAATRTLSSANLSTVTLSTTILSIATLHSAKFGLQKSEMKAGFISLIWLLFAAAGGGSPISEKFAQILGHDPPRSPA